ncbi:MAG: aldehyde dehydrogenase family protein [Planctomycetota bacterium]|nr:aldehyde dehydrogenase family protein [Planctomycetota bacterium]
MDSVIPLHLAGLRATTGRSLDVRDAYTGAIAARVALAGPAELERAIAAAVDSAPALRGTKPYERAALLAACARKFTERAEHLAQALCTEAGKPIRDARCEVTRLVDTFRIASEEATRIEGTVLELEVTARARGYRGMTRRVPVGPCALISPFNFPLNLAAHKIAPAIAAGCPFVLKPASATPLGALAIGDALDEAAREVGFPRGFFSILPLASRDAAPLVEDERLKLLSFTGSGAVGWDMKRRAGKKKVVLELGGNAACIVDRDWDLDDAVARIVFGAFYQSGQSCVKAQRILVHADVAEAFRAKFVAATRALVAGDPHDEKTSIGPLIAESEAVRLETWIAEATARGARVLCGGTRRGAVLDATVIEDVPDDASIACEEAFGPVAVLSTFTDFDAALAQANQSRYGLQAGVFTNTLDHALRAWDVLEVGGVIVGDVPSWRVDSMPYGGVKDSGFGREGVRNAIESMTEPRLLVIRTPEKRG